MLWRELMRQMGKGFGLLLGFRLSALVARAGC